MTDPRSPALGIKQAVDVLGLQPNQRTQLHLCKLATILRNQDGFFGPLNQSDAEVVSKWLGYEFVPPGKPVYQQGQFGESMYIVIGGACEATALTGAPGGKELLVVGQAFGELALVAPRKPRSRTVVAGASGAHLAILNRSALSHMRFLGSAQAEAGRALQAVLAACCMGVLRVPAGSRSPEEVDTLADFMATMEAFKKLPPDMLRRLAADCSHMRLPVGRVVFEEDAPGNCMYAVVSGQCQVRARPLALRQKAPARSLRPGSLGIGMSMSPRGRMSGRHGLNSTPRSLKSFASTVTAAMADASGPRGGGGGGAMRLQGGGHCGGGIATVLTVRADRKRQDARGFQDEAGSGDVDDEDEQEQQQQGQPGGIAEEASANKDSPFWIARFMEDTLKRLNVADSSAGLGQQMTPLAAVAAARWRHVAAERRGSGIAVAEDTADEGGCRAGAAGQAGAGAAAEAVVEGGADGEVMEALLGRAAARALRQAMSDQRGRKGQNGGLYDSEGETDTSPGATAASVAASAAAGAADASGASRPAVPRRVSMMEALNAYSGPAGPGGASAAVAPVVALEDPAKRLLSKLGNRDPANVSRTLLAELVQRADVNVVLYEVAKKLVRRGGGPRRITHTTSKRINKALQHQIRAGPDRLPGTLQGQRVLGRNATLSIKSGASVWTMGLAASLMAGGGGGGNGSRTVRPASPFRGPAGGGITARDGLMSLGDSTAWGEASSMQPGQYPRPRASNNGAPGTRPTSALTSGVSGCDFDTDCGDEESEYDWNGSDLAYSLASYKPSTAASLGTVRRVTAQELDHTTMINADLLHPNELEAVYGPVIRTITPGQSFGELALLHRDSRRTATIITAAAPAGPTTPLSVPVHGTDQMVDLFCVTRHTYNHTVRAAQVVQLQGLLTFLAGLAPFRGLDDQQRASLAVFCRQREVAAGAVIAVQGEPANTLWMIQEGEVVLLDSSATVAEPLQAPPAGARPVLQRQGSQLTFGTPRPGFGQGTGQAGAGAAALGHGGPAGPGPAAGPGGGRALGRQLSTPETGSAGRMGSRLPPAALGVRKDSSGHRRVMFVSGTANHVGATAAADNPLRHVAPGVLMGLGGALTSMGPGGVFGEGLLTTMPRPQGPLGPPAEDEDASRGRKARGRSQAVPSPPPYPCTVIARRPTRLLTISAIDLSRFADLVAAPLAELAAARGEFLAMRAASVTAAKEAVSERVADARRVLRSLRIAMDAGVSVESNPNLAAELRLEESDPLAATTSEAYVPPNAPPAAPTLPSAPTHASRHAAGDRGTYRLAGTTDSLRELAAGWVGVNGSTVRSVSGRRSAQLLPGALLRRLQGQPVTNGATTAAAAALRGTGTLMPEPHPAGDRLSAVLSNGTPRLPEFQVPRDVDRTMSPSPPPVDSSAWPPFFGFGAGNVRCLSTIAEESSCGLLRTTGSHADVTPGTMGGGSLFSTQDVAAAMREVCPDPRVAMEAFSSGSSAEDLLAAEALPEAAAAVDVGATTVAAVEVDATGQSSPQLLPLLLRQTSLVAPSTATISHIAQPNATQLPPLHISSSASSLDRSGSLRRSNPRIFSPSPTPDAAVTRPATADHLPPLQLPRPPRLLSAQIPTLEPARVPLLRFPSQTSSQGSYHSYYEVSPTASTGVARSAGSTGSRRRRSSDGANQVVLSQRTGSASSTAGSAVESIIVYTDDGTASPDLTYVDFEQGGARRLMVLPSVGLRTGRPAAAARRSASNFSEGLIPLSGFTSTVTSTMTSAMTSAVTAVGPGSDDGTVVMEAQGASLERLAGGRPVPLLRDSLFGGRTRHTFSLTGSGRLSNGTSQRSPSEGDTASVISSTYDGGSDADTYDTFQPDAAAPQQALPVGREPHHEHTNAVTFEDPTVWPILPWSHVDGGALLYQQQLLAQQEAADQMAMAMPNLPPLAIVALRRHLANDGDDDVLGSGPQTCSPRAALTDSPLRAHHHHHGVTLVDSPVHSPRVVSQVY